MTNTPPSPAVTDDPRQPRNRRHPLLVFLRRACLHLHRHRLRLLLRQRRRRGCPCGAWIFSRAFGASPRSQRTGGKAAHTHTNKSGHMKARHRGQKKGTHKFNLKKSVRKKKRKTYHMIRVRHGRGKRTVRCVMCAVYVVCCRCVGVCVVISLFLDFRLPHLSV